MENSLRNLALKGKRGKMAAKSSRVQKGFLRIGKHKGILILPRKYKERERERMGSYYLKWWKVKSNAKTGDI